MDPCFAIPRRFTFLCALMLAAMGNLVVPGATAQTRLGIAGLQRVEQTDRIQPGADYATLVPLQQKLPLWAQGGSSAQAVDLRARVHVSVVLSRDASAQAAFDQVVANQQNPNSPLFHQWLTAQQVGELYGPTVDDLASVKSWLTSQGLNIDSISANGLVINASGSMAEVGGAFHTSFGTFAVDGRQRLSAVSEPLIPAALSSVVRSVHGLSETRYEPQSRVSVRTLPAAGLKPQVDLGGGLYAVLPNDFAVIYDIANVYAAGNTGAKIGSKAQRIAIIGKSRIVATDITNYEALAGLPSIQPNTVLAGTDPGVATGANVGYASEATLDVDRVIGTAPGAQADLVISADTNTSDGVDVAIAYNIDTLRDPVMSISFGSCEAQNGSSETDYLNSLFETAASEGISTFVSSDDSGVAGCDTPFTPVTAAELPQVASINVLCSSGYVTCVGGTEFNDEGTPSLYWSSTNANNGYESALSYIPEGAWNESSSVSSSGATVYQVAAGGGGVSSYITKPSWQAGVGVPADGFRDVPDVSFTAADHDGYLGCFAAGGGSCVSSSSGTEITVFSGTSAAAPGMAGIAALLNTKVGAAQGNINPMLYKVAASTPGAFHDTTLASSGVAGCVATSPSMCNNSTPGEGALSDGLAGYLVGNGYDQATGLGSLDVANFLTAVSGTGGSGGGGTTGSFTLVASPATLSVTPVANTTTTSTWTLTGSSVSGFAGTVTLSCAITPVTAQPPTCAISPVTLNLAAGGTGTATISVTSAGPYNQCLTNSASNRTGEIGGAALAGLLLLLIPVKRRKVLRGAVLVGMLGVGMGLLNGCAAPVTVVCSNVVSAGTTAGAYTVTVTGTSGSLSATAPVTINVTVN
jgi:subtilase family serine protease